VKIVIRDRDETSELAQEEISQESNKNQEPRTLNVEVVNTPQSTTQGLSGRNEIGSDGMLFIFPTTEIRYFWMKDMKFDLDLVWIANGQVIEVTKSVSKPDENTPDYRLETYHAQKAADMVLEIKSGDAQINEISPGDVVLLEQ
jgi:hypothetical protein